MLSLRFLWHWCARWPLVGGVAVLLLSILSFNGLGTLGVPDLFWRLSTRASLLAGIGVALVFAVLSFVGYLLESEDLARRSPRVTLIGYWLRTYPVLFLVFAIGLVRARHERWLAMLLGWLLGFCAIGAATLVLLRIAHRIAWRTRNTRARQYLLPRASGAMLHLHIYGALVAAITIAGYVLLSTVRPLYELIRAPFALAIVLSIITLLYGWVLFRYPRQRFVIAGVVILAIALSNYVGYRYRYPGFDYANPRSVASSGAGVALVPDDLEPWRALNARLDGNPKPKLVVIAASGGGVRAAAWTSAVLGQLSYCTPGLDNFPYHVRLVTGSSGGMVGSTDFVARLPPPGRGRSGPCYATEIASDALDPVARALALRDVPKLVLPFHFADRGIALEDAWARNSPPMALTFGQLAAGEREGWRPSLVFTPMFAEDGRRLMVSNLDVSRLTYAADPNDPTRVFSRRAVELRRILPEAERMRLATAARMNAAFPYITPAAELPLLPRRHIVDGGYYDNYGVSTAAVWIADHAQWLAANTSGVALIQIRDVELQRTLVDPTKPSSSWLTTHLGELVAPPIAVIDAVLSVPLFRNDEAVEHLGRLFPPGFFATFVFENTNTQPLSWSLTDEQRAQIDRGFVPQRDAAKLVAWWKR